MKRVLLGLLVGCMTMAFAGVALAGPNDDVGISLHSQIPPQKATSCLNDAPDFTQNGDRDIDTKAEGGGWCRKGKRVASFDVWVVICNINDSVGVAGAEFGLEYDAAFGSGVDVLSWKRCSDLDFPTDNWPGSGSGNVVTWESGGNCQTNVPFAGEGQNNGIAVAGVLRIASFGQDQMEVVPRPTSGYLKVADCAAVEDNLTNAAVPRGGITVFCINRKGYNYCRGFKLDTAPTTWGAIKGQYN